MGGISLDFFGGIRVIIIQMHSYDVFELKFDQIKVTLFTLKFTSVVQVFLEFQQSLCSFHLTQEGIVYLLYF